MIDQILKDVDVDKFLKGSKISKAKRIGHKLMNKTKKKEKLKAKNERLEKELNEMKE